MTILNALFIYLLIWWVMLFTVLPLGVERNADANKGHDAGAPTRADMKRKLALNTLISGVILAVIWILVDMGVITWGEWFRGPSK
jgi:predicted secreted protein